MGISGRCIVLDHVDVKTTSYDVAMLRNIALVLDRVLCAGVFTLRNETACTCCSEISGMGSYCSSIWEDGFAICNVNGEDAYLWGGGPYKVSIHIGVTFVRFHTRRRAFVTPVAKH